MGSDFLLSNLNLVNARANDDADVGTFEGQFSPQFSEEQVILVQHRSNREPAIGSQQMQQTIS
jgi:hypothetical protein